MLMNIIAWGPQVMGVKLFLKRVWAMIVIAHVEGSIEMLVAITFGPLGGHFKTLLLYE